MASRANMEQRVRGRIWNEKRYNSKVSMLMNFVAAEKRNINPNNTFSVVAVLRSHEGVVLPRVLCDVSGVDISLRREGYDRRELYLS